MMCCQRSCVGSGAMGGAAVVHAPREIAAAQAITTRFIILER